VPDAIQREILPIPDRPYSGFVAYDAKSRLQRLRRPHQHTRFHTTALCSPTRQALLTGRNHHAVGMGGITEIATSALGHNSIRPNTAAPLAETLKLNGYSTAQFGKCHEVPVWETSPAGPFDAWATGGGGFEYFYGFIGGEAHQYYPALYEGTNPVEPSKTPEEGYHLVEDMTDKAIKWVRQQKTADW
jgi:arylsulfatase A-like enzyme